jgi:23S rRNA pseudouridine2605 synthase
VSGAEKPGNARRVGLARALSKLGYCSRSQAFALIHAGKVAVNGKVERDAERPTNLDRDRIQVESAPVVQAELAYLAVNKPRGVVTTAADEKGRNTVYALLPSELPWVGPVGRLDKASEGLLLMTNDSEWAARITDPGSHLDKRYHVQIAAVPSAKLVERLEQGVRSEGELLRAKTVSMLRAGEKHGWLEIVLDEGRNRQIRRILEGLDVEVLRLIRVAIGPLLVGELPKGSWRPLRAEEKSGMDVALRHNAGRR